MSDRNALTPRVFIVRHGETEWSKSGRSTSFTEVDLTAAGVAQVSHTAATLVGFGKLIDPSRIAHVFVSPRMRAKKTWELLLPNPSEFSKKITFADDVTEWNYGAYEGLKNEEIRRRREEKGWDKERRWNIWSDGCEGGESPLDIAARLDKLILQIKNIQAPLMDGTKPADIVLVAHGLILRCFVRRWLGYPVSDGPEMMLEPGAIGILSYNNNSVISPAIHVGIQIRSK